jgi:SAM-dependent methyltransferase
VELTRTAKEQLKRYPSVYRQARRVANVRGQLPPMRKEGLPGRVHRNDFMFYGPSGSYGQTGRETADIVLEAAAGAAPESWLDYGCGYGRVLRWLTQEVDPAKVGCYDVNAEATAFCAREFGVTAMRGSAPPATLTLGRWDFVYAISVVTHLPGNDFFGLLERLLNPGGTVLFTVHGDWSVENIAHYGPQYAGQQERVRSDLAAHGISYIPYPYGDGGLGMTWHTHAHVMEQMSRLDLVGWRQDAVPGNHDVYVFRRPGA